MKYFLPLALLLTGCATAPELTNVVSAPVRVSCVTVIPLLPVLLTPCAVDADSATCLINYIVDNTTLLGYTAKLTAQLKACQ